MTISPSPAIGESRVFQNLMEKTMKLAKINRPILILGERGSGKDLIATRLHYHSVRWDKPFIKLNCAALTNELLDSELFGHELGAFTGAVKKHQGKIERASEGTLFLDEISTMSFRAQEKLLRVIEYGELERVGGTSLINMDVRFIGATNANLSTLAKKGDFRADLLDRLAFDVINVPPLRERGEDILVLANHFAQKMVSEIGGACFSGFSDSALDQLYAHSWPGNVRELKNVVERTVFYEFHEGRRIQKIHLDPFFSTNLMTKPIEETLPKESPALKPDFSIFSGLEQNAPFNFTKLLEQIQSRLVSQALRSNAFNQRKTAEFLGMSYHQLRGLLKKFRALKETPR